MNEIFSHLERCRLNLFVQAKAVFWDRFKSLTFSVLIKARVIFPAASPPRFGVSKHLKFIDRFLINHDLYYPRPSKLKLLELCQFFFSSKRAYFYPVGKIRKFFYS